MRFSDGACRACITAARAEKGARVFESWAEDVNTVLYDLFDDLNHERLHAL